jgi:hypothetical protein
MVPDKKE